MGSCSGLVKRRERGYSTLKDKDDLVKVVVHMSSHKYGRFFLGEMR